MMDQATFNHELTRALPALRRWCFSLVRRRVDLGDDLVQETVRLALLNLDKYRDEGRIEAWLATIARNAWRTQLRHIRRFEYVADSRDEDQTPDRDTPESILMRKQATAATGRVLATMTAAMRQAVIMAGMGFHINEAARITQTEPNTVKTRVHRGRAQLARERELAFR